MRVSPQVLLFHVAFAAGLFACGSTPQPSPGTSAAWAHYQRGDFPSARRAADVELATAPAERSLWRLKIDAAIRAGDHAGGVDAYIEWHKLRRHYDKQAIRSMAISSLWHALVADGPESRVLALRALQRTRAPELDADIAEHLRAPDPRAAALAATIVRGARGRERARALLANADASVRAQLIAGLPRQYRDSLHTQVLAGLGDRDTSVRTAAAAVVGRWRLKGGAETLLHLAARDPDGKVRAAALSALARPELQSALRSGRGAVSSVARSALADSYLGARLAALKILAARPGAHRDALAQAATGSDSFLALRAAIALRKAGGEIPINALQLALVHRQWSVRVAALNAIGRLLPARDAVSLVSERLTDPRIEVRLAAARALASLGHKSRAHAVFVSALEADRDLPRLQAAVDLLRMKDDLGRDALTRLATSPSPETRRQAVHAHGYLEQPTLPLIRALGDPVPAVRLTAAVTLIRLL